MPLTSQLWLVISILIGPIQADRLLKSRQQSCHALCLLRRTNRMTLRPITPFLKRVSCFSRLR